MEPWAALEHLMLKHALPKALRRYNVDLQDPSLEGVLTEKKNKKALIDIFRAYSRTGRDKKIGRLLSYESWEKFCKDLIRVANRSGINFELPSLRDQQFAFFTSISLFSLSERVSGSELRSKEFSDAVVRLAFRMVRRNNRKSSRKLIGSEEKYETIGDRAAVAIKWIESLGKSRK